MNCERAKSLSRYYWSQIPIVGHLANCTVEEHKSALREFVAILIFSTATFWLSGFLLLSLPDGERKDLWAVIRTTMQSGELFVFSLGFVGPAIWLTLDDPQRARLFPGRALHTLPLVIILAVCVLFFARTRTSTVLPGTYEANYIFHVSVWVALFAVVLRYLAMVYRRETYVNPEKIMKAGEEDFSKRFQDTHEGQSDAQD